MSRMAAVMSVMSAMMAAVSALVARMPAVVVMVVPVMLWCRDSGNVWVVRRIIPAIWNVDRCSTDISR